MAKQYFAVLTINYEDLADGLKITVTTDAPCHLFMRWTYTTPKQHAIPVYRRGLAMHTDKYFCFDNYHDNEQEEAGDTLTHTFIKEPWAVCETRYFYFHGNIEGEASPSTTAIFSKHRLYAPVPHEETFCLHSESGWTNKSGNDWTIVREFPTGGQYESTSRIYVWARRSSPGTYYIRRAPLRFDTSAIPPEATITEALFSFHVYTLYNVGSPETRLKSCLALGADMAATDYGTIHACNVPMMGDISHGILAAGGDYQFPIWAVAYQYIMKGGITRLALKANFDEDDIAPQRGVREHRLEIGGANDATNPTCLKIKWTV